MLNLRFAFQKCVPRASILGNSPICHQTPRSSNAIHISRLSYSDGNTQEAESTSQQMTHAEMNHSKKAEATKSPPAIANDPEVNSAPPVIEYETLKKVQRSMNLDFRRYHIFVRGYSRNISQKMLEKFYSQFGQVIQCVLYKNKQGVPEALVVFTSKKAMDRALESSPHRIQQEHVTAEIGTHHRQFNLRVLDLSPETTEESLRAFYSRFGSLTQCVVSKDSETGAAHGKGYVTFASHEELDRALDAQPHVIDGSEVFLNYSTDELDLMVKELPEGITEESLHSFFSQYGRVRRCELVTGKSGKAHAFLTFSTVNEVNRAMSDRPHIIDKNLLKTDYPGKPGLFPIFVGSLPENVSRMSLFNAFSQFGNIVHLEIRNNGNQSRPYGFVSYGTRQEASKALNAGPHEVDGVSVDVKKAKERNKEK